MRLKVYRKKRDFKKTAEPKGRLTRSKKRKNLYIIQKHAASHLHYDLRLELNGVLLSWAVPKGPCLDASVKRLAVHVEDHPLEYGSFEGIIPKGQYGGGTVMLWDKGEWICADPDPEKAYRKGELTFTLKGKKLRGKWKLVRMHRDDKNWLLMKLKDEYAKPLKQYDITVEEPNSVVSHASIDEIAEKVKKKQLDLSLINHHLTHLTPKPFPKIIHPELASLVSKPPEGDNWLYEIKFDGYRLLIFKKGKKVTIFTRHHHDWTHKFKKIANEVAKLPVENLVIDGEVVALDEHQHSNFQLLQNSLKENKVDFFYYAFDLLYFDKFNLMTLSLLERKNILQQILLSQNSKTLFYSDDIFGSGQKIFNNACKLGLEGIISKEISSTYSQTRSKNWLKMKCIKRQEFVIGGFNKSTRRKYFKSLMLGTFNKDKELIYHGNVGTGFTQASLKTVYALLSKHITNTMPFSHQPPASKNAIWVEPNIVAEVEFTEWTNDGTLRHPSFKGIRMDKPAIQIVKEVEMPIKAAKSSFKLTHPDKILYPESKITKQEIAEYYENVQSWILPYITDRPLTLVRCPSTYKQCFFQKHIDGKLPAGVYGVMIKEKSSKSRYMYIEDNQGLLALCQLNVLEFHPWGSRVESVDYPDMITFDLDPAPELAFKKVVNAAFEIKEILSEFKLKSFIKTTGGKGLHVVIPIKPEYSWDEVKIFSKTVVDYLVMNSPKQYVSVMAKSKRKDKIFIDYLRNQRGATAIAPYSTRARKKAPVATPLAWDELTHDVRDTTFTIETLPKRLDSLKKDPWGDFFKIKQSLRLDKIK